MMQWVLVLAAPVLIAFALWALRAPMRVALPAYAALVPFGGAFAVGASKFGSLSSLVGLLLGLGLLLQTVGTRRGAVRLSPTVAVWLLFLGTAALTTLWSISPSETISGLVVLASLVLVYVFVALSHVDRVVVRRTENGLLLGGVAVCCYGLFQLVVLGGFPSDVPGVGVAPDGRFGNDLLGPDNEAVALVLPLALAITRATTASERRQRVFNLLISGVLLVGVLMTGSRGGILAVFVVVLVLAFSTPRHGRSRLLAFGVAGLIVAAFVWVYHPAGIAERTTSDVASSSGRTDIWRVGVAACPQYCPLGSGWGTFPDVYADTQASVPDAHVLVGKGGSYQPHNVWLLAAIELGLPGLALLAAGLLLTLLAASRLPIARRGPPLSALVGTVFAASFLSNLEFKFFWMALIMVALHNNMSDADKYSRPTVEMSPPNERMRLSPAPRT